MIIWHCKKISNSIIFRMKIFPKHQPRLRPADLPIISFPSPFQSEESSSESDSPFETESPSQTSTPTAPSTPSTYLGTSFSYIALSSQTSEEQVFATPSKPKRKRYVRKPKYNLQKGNTLAVKYKFTGQESVKEVRPSSYFYKDLRFEKERETFDVKIYSNEKDYHKELRPASGNQIMNLAILAQVFNQLNCPDRACRGSLHLLRALITGRTSEISPPQVQHVSRSSCRISSIITNWPPSRIWRQ